MAQKNYSEMTFFQRMRYSLGAKMFRRIFLFSALLSLFAMGIAFALHMQNIIDQYAKLTNSSASQAWMMVDQEKVIGYMDRVFQAYKEQGQNRSAENGNTLADYMEYISTTCKLRDEEYFALQDELDKFCSYSEVYSVYIAIYDKDANHIVYVLDSDKSGAGMMPGAYAIFQNEDIDIFEATDDMPEYMLLRSDLFGLVCASRYVIRSTDNYEYAVFCDVDMRRILTVSAQFLIAFVLILMTVSFVMTMAFVLYINRKVTSPINRLAQAAGGYSRDKESGTLENIHFRNLGIHTMDEIENLSNVLEEMETDISEYYENMLKAEIEKEHLNSEMEIAERIQNGTLPSVFPPFPDLTDLIDIYALMDPAKEVGGDFYDFFKIDDEHLAVLIADVSGKGIPGALFMMVSKMMIFNNAKMIGNDPARILEVVNDSIMENNKAEMFVTVWLGILELSTGHMICTNAGHEYPFIQRAGGQFEMLKDKHGFVVGGMDNVHYKNYEIDLNAGDCVFVYTDGAPEANNPEGEMFGTERISEVLNKDPECSMNDLLKDMKESIFAFTRDAVQFDDITMVGLRYFGGSDMKEMTITATLDNIPTVTDFVDSKLEKFSFPGKVITQINIAIDELFSNIARYAYYPDVGPATVRVEVEDEPPAIVITFIDNGQPYDPLSSKEPDVSLSAEERKIGGLGIFMVRKLMDDIHYEYKDGKNILRIKHILKR